MRDIIARTKNLLKHHLFLRALLGKLQYIGIRIVPYYITREYLNPELRPRLNHGAGPFTLSLIPPSEIVNLLSQGLDVSLAKQPDEECLGFVLKHREEIAACTCCNLYRCRSRFANFPLQGDEAYLYNAATLKAYRGMNLAPYLRNEVYRYLNGIGRSKYYSITEFFNTPALKFKEKLGARPARLGLYILLFKRKQLNITLKRYRDIDAAGATARPQLSPRSRRQS